VIFLLDTNAVAALTTENPAFMEKRLGFAAGDFAISSIVAFELLFGASRHAQTAKYLELYDRLGLEVIPFDVDDARAAGRIRASLLADGIPIGPYDILIAGQALARDLTLISRNVREFSRVDGLRVENWEA
jgi:tRNA(fMet)-specific endonuclease VapC